MSWATVLALLAAWALWKRARRDAGAWDQRTRRTRWIGWRTGWQEVARRRRGL